MAKCEFCDKGVTFGIQVSHSHRRSNRTWKPNVKRVKAIVNGSPPLHFKKIFPFTRILTLGVLSFNTRFFEILFFFRHMPIFPTQ